LPRSHPEQRKNSCPQRASAQMMKRSESTSRSSGREKICSTGPARETYRSATNVPVVEGSVFHHRAFTILSSPPWFSPDCGYTSKFAQFVRTTDKLGVSMVSVGRWLRNRESAALVPVQVIDVPAAVSRFEVVTPRGLRVVGLDMIALCTLLERHG
jgi:hypothetical protein